MRRILALPVAALLLGGLAGCDDDAGPPPIVVTPQPTITSVLRTPQRTSATGELTGAAAGTVQVRGDSVDGVVLTVHLTRADATRPLTAELATSVADADCTLADDRPDGRIVPFGDVTAGRTAVLRFPLLENTAGDLSYLKVLVLTEHDATGDCVPAHLASAVLRWTRSPALAGLRAVDGGATLGAMGATAGTGGAPRSYTVEPDDQLLDVAHRFGFTPDELLYLNPRRARGDSRTLYVDEVLNLDPSRR